MSDNIRKDILRVIEEIRGNPVEVSAYFFVWRTGHNEDEVYAVLTELCGEGLLSVEHGANFDTYHVI
jgi:hypothetical protein